MLTKEPPVSSDGPADRELTAQLGRSRAVWDELIAGIERVHAPATREWLFTAKTASWHLRLKQNARTILYLIPREKYFLTAFVFGEKAVMEILAGNFSQQVLTALHHAPRYAEGTGIRLVTRNRRDVTTMLKLAAVKLAN